MHGSHRSSSLWCERVRVHIQVAQNAQHLPLYIWGRTDVTITSCSGDILAIIIIYYSRLFRIIINGGNLVWVWKLMPRLRVISRIGLKYRQRVR